MLRPVIIFAIVTCVLACNDTQQGTAAVQADKVPDTLHIWADSSLRVVVNEQKKAFENQYNSPALSVAYLDEVQIVKGLLDNQINCAVLHRNLQENEAGYMAS